MNLYFFLENLDNLKQKRQLILKFSLKNNLPIDHFMTRTKIPCHLAEGIYRHQQQCSPLGPGDSLVTLSPLHLGSSFTQALSHAISLKNLGVDLIFIEDNQWTEAFNGPQQLQLLKKVYQLNSDFLSFRTKAGLQKAKKKGKQLGRPHGTQLSSKIDKKIPVIIHRYKSGESLKTICQDLAIPLSSAYWYFKTRKINLKQLKTIH